MGTDKLEKVLVRMAVSEDTISPSNETATGKIASQLKALRRGRPLRHNEVLEVCSVDGT